MAVVSTTIGPRVSVKPASTESPIEIPTGRDSPVSGARSM